jgi:carboxymethylenebutenolidase
MITRTVSFSSGNQDVEAYLAHSEVEGPFPGAVVIHDAFGMNDNIKNVAERFVGEGYVALAVDLLAECSRAVCMACFMAGMLFKPFDNAGIRGLKADLGVLAEQPMMDTARLGAIGFYLGGGFAIAWACTDERLRVVVAPLYSMNPRPLDAAFRACPVVGSYPEKDFTVRPSWT